MECGVPLNTRGSFQDDERKKSNGNVCCRVSTINLPKPTDEVTDDYADVDAVYNQIHDDTRASEIFCSQRTGYR